MRQERLQLRLVAGIELKSRQKSLLQYTYPRWGMCSRCIGSRLLDLNPGNYTMNQKC
jgi:hypothetical protein